MDIHLEAVSMEAGHNLTYSMQTLMFTALLEEIKV